MRLPARTLLLLCLAAGCGPRMTLPQGTSGQAWQAPAAEPASGETEVLAEGVSAFAGAWDTARDQAISDALRKAVEQGVGTYIDSETQVENFQLISDRIYSRARGYVSSYRIIHEEQTGDLYRVVLRAVVNTDGLQDDLAAIGILLAEQGRPRVMVVVREIGNGATLEDAGSSGSMFETLLLDQFRRKGFPVVDAGTAAGILQRDRLLLILEGDERTAALVGLEAGAEIMVSGTVNVSREQRMIAGAAREIHVFRVNCRAINTRTAAVLGASAATTEVPFSESQARSQASDRTAEQLVSAILQGWTTSGNTTVIVASNADYSRMQDLSSRIRTGIRGVTEVLARDLTGSRATLEVISTTSSREIMDGLSAIGGGFTITGVAGNRVELRFTD